MRRIGRADGFLSLHKVIDIGRNKRTASSSSPVVDASLSAVFPSLQRLDTDDMGPSRPPPTAGQPVLTLTLSKPSFLDTHVHDDADGSHLYTIATRGRRTYIHRTVQQGDVEEVACIRWPQETNALLKEVSTGIIVQMGGGRARFKPVEEFLKFSGFFNSRKFSLPHYNNSLKWKKASGNFQLSTSTVRLVAVLEPAVLSAPPRVKIYDPLYNPDPSRPQLHHGGVPIVLLDYIVTTSLLLVTDEEEWLNFAIDNAHSASVSSPSIQNSARQTRQTLTTAEANPSNDVVDKWRHQVHAEQVRVRATSPLSRPSSPASSQHTTPSAQLERVSVHSSGTSSFTNQDNPQTPASGPIHPYARGYTGITSSPVELVPPVPDIPHPFNSQTNSTETQINSPPQLSYGMLTQPARSYHPSHTRSNTSKPPPTQPLPMSPNSPPSNSYSSPLPRPRRELPRIPSHQGPLSGSYHTAPTYQQRQVSLPPICSPGSSTQPTPSPPPPHEYAHVVQGQLPPVLDDSFRSRSVPAKLANEYRPQPQPPFQRATRPETMVSFPYRSYNETHAEMSIRPSTSTAATFPIPPPPPPLNTIYPPVHQDSYVSAPSSSYPPLQPPMEGLRQPPGPPPPLGTNMALGGNNVFNGTSLPERRQASDDPSQGVSHATLGSVLEDVEYSLNRLSVAFETEPPPPAYESINFVSHDRGAQVH